MRPEGTVLYLDASALVKLVIAEYETPALQQAVGIGALLATSALSGVEVRRAVLRGADTPEILARADAVLARCTLVEVHRAVWTRAAELRPARLRTLDAIHLATALELGPDLGAFVAYDTRLREAASGAGLPLLTPGA